MHSYYRQITDVDIGEIARELLVAKIIQESRQTLFCDCPNHASQSHRSFHVSLEEQCRCCWGCGVGGDVLQFVEFVHHGVVTRGQSGRMPESHRAARDFLARRVGLPPLSKLASTEDAEGSYQRLNLHALFGAQRADVGSVRAIWAIQDRIALSVDEEKALDLKREVAAGQERVIWNPALSLPPKAYEFTDSEIARIRSVLETWDSYGVAVPKTRSPDPCACRAGRQFRAPAPVAIRDRRWQI